MRRGETRCKSVTLTNHASTAQQGWLFAEVPGGNGGYAGTISLDGVIVSGVTQLPYSLGPGESVDARIRFTSSGTPGHVYTYVANVSTGALCMSQGLGVQITAEARDAPRPPSCALSRTSLDFGSVPVGQSKDLTFDLENSGDGTQCGSMTENCPDFAVIQNSSYCITPPVFVPVTVRFSPTSTGLKQCTISPGANCPPVTVTGSGS